MRRRVLYRRVRWLGGVAGIAGPFATPFIDAVGVGRSAEIVAALIGPSPSAVACGLAGLLTVGLGAVPLMVAAAWLGIVQLVTAAALMSSATAWHVSRSRTGWRRGQPAGSSEQDPREEDQNKVGRRRLRWSRGRKPTRRTATSDRPNQSAFSLAVAKRVQLGRWPESG